MTKSLHENLRTVGHSVERIDGLEKATGTATYVDDIDFGPGLLHAEIIESPHAHALIKKIDTAAAAKVPGVVKVVTGKDFPVKFGMYMKDRFIFAIDRVRFIGEQVAAVVARCPKIAKRAAKLVKVEYEALEPVLEPLDAVKKGAVLLHPELIDYPRVPWFYPEKGTNIAHLRKTRKGSIDAGFAEADVVLEDTYKVPRYAHCCIEPHIAVAQYDHSGRMTVWSSSQSPHTQRNLFAQALESFGLTHKDVRVITPYIGGGFGGKAGVCMEILAVVLAMACKGRPVKVRWRRDQEFNNTYLRQGIVGKIKMGAKKDGTITAIKYELFFDAGPYVEYGANVVNAAGLSASGPYRIDNLHIDSYCLYTNCPPGGPYRGFGYSEFSFGLESHIDRMAEKLGLSPRAIRLKNAIKEGDALGYGAPMNPCSLHECINKAADAIELEKKMVSTDPNKVIGKGLACFWKGPAMPPNASSSSFLKFNEDGSLNVLISAMEMGQGVLTAMAQIASEILGVPTSKIRVETPDTDRNPYEWQSVASHITWGCGNAVQKAAVDAREKIFDLVERALLIEREGLYLEDEQVKCRTKPGWGVPLKNFVIDGFMMKDGTYRGGPIMGTGVYMPEFSTAVCDKETSQGGKPNVHYTVGAAGIILEIDKDTGKMHVKKVALAADVGKALNPDMVEGQIVGGMLQGLATALYEDIAFDENGKLLNPNFTDYKIPTAKDIPDEVVSIIVETPQPDGPFGARGVGEHTMIASAPIVGNAIYDALKLRMTSMPMTAEQVALGLHQGVERRTDVLYPKRTEAYCKRGLKP